MAVGPALSQALDGRSTPVASLAAVLGWGAWLAALVATLVPRTASLTVYRLVAPAAVAVAAWTLPAGAGPAAVAGALTAAVVAAVVAFLPATGDVFVDGSSYGPERRLALRPPAALLLGPIPVAWLVAAGGFAAPQLLQAAKQWVAGAVALAAGWPAAAIAVSRLHVLARRWIVLVPAGLVVHDPLALADAALFARRSIVAIRPAPVGTEAFDLTFNALGLAIEIDFDEPQELSVPQGRGKPAATVSAAAIICTPSRPAGLLEAARDHRLPLG